MCRCCLVVRCSKMSCGLVSIARWTLYLVMLTVGLFPPSSGHAEASRRSHTRPIIERGAEFEEALRDLGGRSSVRQTLRFSLLVQAEGRLHFTATEQRRVGSSVFMRGFVTGVNRSGHRNARLLRSRLAVSVSGAQGAPELSATFQRPTLSGRGGRRYYKILIVRKEGELVASLRRASHFLLRGKTCGEDLIAEGESGSQPLDAGTPLGAPVETLSVAALDTSVAAATTAVRRIDVIVDTDKEYTDLYGGSPTSRIASVLNAANVFYVGDLGLELNLQGSVIATSTTTYPTSMTDASALLTRYAQVISGTGARSSDVNVLFTGKDLASTVIGLATVSSICRITPPVALVQRLHDAVDHIILAHEVGHSLSALHTSSGIMGSSLNLSSPPTAFSADSIVAIAGYVAQYGSCLASTTVATTPTPTPVVTATPTPTRTPTPSGSPSPTPSATASPSPDTPSPTPTLSPGGGGGGGALPSPTPTSSGSLPPPGMGATPTPGGGVATPVPPVFPTRVGAPRESVPGVSPPQVRVSFSGRGLSGSVLWAASGASDCAIEFQLHNRRRQDGGGIPIGTFAAGDAAFSLPFRTTFFNPREAMYLSVVTKCGGVTTTVSKNFVIRADRISSGRVVSSQAWIKRAKRDFKVEGAL